MGKGSCFDQFYIIKTCARLLFFFCTIYAETTDLATEKLEELESYHQFKLERV